MVDTIFEAIEQYGLVIFFGALGILLFIYPFIENRMTFNIKDIALYWAIGVFFSTLAIAFLAQNGVVIGVLLTLLFGALFLWMGVSELHNVFKHSVEVGRKLIDVRKELGFDVKFRVHYQLTFYVPERKANYISKDNSSADGFTVGETYIIYISNEGNTAVIHWNSKFLLGMLVTLFGLVWLALLLKILNII